jgi:hypothetical protein
MPKAGENMPERFSQLQQVKEETLKELLRLKPGQKHYRRALKAYLKADHALQRVIIDRLGLDFHA